MEETAVAVEIGEVLRRLDAHRLERQNGTALGFPLNRGETHTADPATREGIVLRKHHGERIVAAVTLATRAVIVAGATVGRRRGSEQEVEAKELLLSYLNCGKQE